MNMARRKIEYVKQKQRKTSKRIVVKLLGLKTTISKTNIYTRWD